MNRVLHAIWWNLSFFLLLRISPDLLSIYPLFLRNQVHLLLNISWCDLSLSRESDLINELRAMTILLKTIYQTLSLFLSISHTYSLQNQVYVTLTKLSLWKFQYRKKNVFLAKWLHWLGCKFELKLVQISTKKLLYSI